MTSFPPDLPLFLDSSTRILPDARTLVGGVPLRALRLSPSGSRTLDQLQVSGAGSSAAAQRLARHLVQTGLAHPRPRPAAMRQGEVSVVIPVRDRPEALERCLSTLRAEEAHSSVPLDVVVVDDASRDRGLLEQTCVRHRARLVHRAAGGPAAARNTGAAATDSRLVAFLDSDCVPTAGWIETLMGHLVDPSVAAAAPRVLPRVAGDRAIHRYAAARSPLDLGALPGEVGPSAAIAYVPAAALLVRRDRLGSGFEETLRYGEDVDLVWRLLAAGWRVRYDPAAVVHHHEPSRAIQLLRRRHHYGTSAAALSRRHPGAVAHATLEPWSAASVSLVLTGRRRGVVVGVLLAALHYRHSSTDSPAAGAIPRLWAQRYVATALAVATWSTTMVPALLLAGLRRRATRLPAAVLLFGSPVNEWLRRRPRLDPVRFSLCFLADELAYGSGVWTGCLRARTIAPLVPRLARGIGKARRPREGCSPR